MIRSMSDSKIKQLRETLCQIGQRIYAKGWVASNDGNLSARVDPSGQAGTQEGRFLITPSGVSKGDLTPEGLLLVDGQGNTLEGSGRVSSEWKMHQKVYERRPEMGAVVHTHAPASTAFAVAGLPLDLPVLPELVFGLGGVPMVPYHLPGSGELYDGIDPYVTQANALLLKNHGLVTFGADPWAAFYCHESVEHAAQIQILARSLGHVDLLTPGQVEALVQLRKAAGILSPWYPVRYDSR